MEKMLFVVAIALTFSVGITSGADELETAPPKPTDLLVCARLALLVESCWALGADLPLCSGKSRLQACTELVQKNISQCPIELIQRFMKSAADNFANSDKILCNNQLYKQFLNDPDCWMWSRSAALRVVYVTKGLLTADGCKTIQFTTQLFKTVVGTKCGALMAKYIDPLYNASACGKSGGLLEENRVDMEKMKNLLQGFRYSNAVV